MRTHFGILVVLLGLSVAGCAQEHVRRVAREPNFYVPTAAIVQMPETPAISTASQVLPASDGLYYIPRGEKTVLGDIPIYGSSSFVIFTYDVQRIASRGDGGGYRYTWGVQQGISVP